jgi:hypothetical protein
MVLSKDRFIPIALACEKGLFGYGQLFLLLFLLRYPFRKLLAVGYPSFFDRDLRHASDIFDIRSWLDKPFEVLPIPYEQGKLKLEYV